MRIKSLAAFINLDWQITVTVTADDTQSTYRVKVSSAASADKVHIKPTLREALALALDIVGAE